MSVKCSGFGMIEKNLTRVINNAVVTPARESIKQSASDVAFVAVEMAPRYTGTLEDSIITQTKQQQPKYHAQSTVYIDPRSYNSLQKIKAAAYAKEAHDEITPTGDRNLGYFSAEKQKVSEYPVGGGFFSRALKYLKDNILKDLKNKVNSELSKFS